MQLKPGPTSNEHLVVPNNHRRLEGVVQELNATFTKLQQEGEGLEQTIRILEQSSETIPKSPTVTSSDAVMVGEEMQYYKEQLRMVHAKMSTISDELAGYETRLKEIENRKE